MKITVGQTKRGIVMVFEDTSNDTSRTINLNYREAAGLYHELKDAFEKPAFEQRDPRSKNKEIRNQKTIEISQEELESAKKWRQENFPGINDSDYDARKHQSYYS